MPLPWGYPAQQTLVHREQQQRARPGGALSGGAGTGKKALVHRWVTHFPLGTCNTAPTCPSHTLVQTTDLTGKWLCRTEARYSLASSCALGWGSPTCSSSTPGVRAQHPLGFSFPSKHWWQPAQHSMLVPTSQQQLTSVRHCVTMRLLSVGVPEGDGETLARKTPQAVAASSLALMAAPFPPLREERMDGAPFLWSPLTLWFAAIAPGQWPGST